MTINFEERMKFCNRLRTKIKAAGCNGEYRDTKGVFEWIPRADSTAEQIAASKKIIDSYDDKADAEQKAVEAVATLEKDQIVMALLSEINYLREKAGLPKRTAANLIYK